MAYFSPYDEREKRLTLLKNPSGIDSSEYQTQMGGSQMAQGAGSLLMGAGAVPSPASPFLMGAGLALQAGGMIYDAVSGSKDKKRAEKLEDEQWALTRRKLLMDMAEQKRKDEWKRSFARTLLYGGGPKNA